MSEIINIVLLLILVAVGLELSFFALKYIVSKRNTDDDDDINYIVRKNESQNKVEGFGKFHDVLKRDSILEFLNFEKVQDGMIVRDEATEYAMVLQCNGVNFDLRSENEKLGIEEGFMQFLNTLKYPVQLYVQTRSLNFTETLNKYHSRIDGFRGQIEEIEKNIEKAKAVGDEEKVNSLNFEKQKKLNLYEYALDTIKYTEGLNKNKNVLQQKTYVIVSYNVSEIGPKLQEYTMEERSDFVFEELHTRCNTLISALMMSQVSARILDSEELVELLFNAYNRDELENINLKEYLRKDYDSLYTRSEDYFVKRKKLIENEISRAAVELASTSIIKADKKRRMEILNMKLKKADKIKETAEALIEDKKSVLFAETYNEAKRMVKEADTSKYDDDEAKKLKADIKGKDESEIDKIEQEEIQNFISREYNDKK